MKNSNTRYINLLEQLSYVLECAAVEAIGLAETELENLCNRMETDRALQFDSWREVHGELQEALMTYKTGEFIRAASLLSGISRRSWKLLKEKVD
jgi:hypothetical protein